MHLHLKHVLQTVCALEAVVLRSFGPEGGQVLFTRDTAEAMLSRSGTRILTALRLEHPLARMVVECVCKHSSATGDGSKTFILLLASLLRMIHTNACKEPNVSHNYHSREAAEAATARHLADELLAFALKKLDELITMGVVPYGYCVSWEDFTAKTHSQGHKNYCHVKELLASFFHTRLGYTHCDLITSLTCELLTNWNFKNDLPSLSLKFVNDNFPALHTPVSGFPISCSRLIEGQVIHRDFATPCPKADHRPIKAVVFTGYLQSQLLDAGIVQFSAWAERSLESVIANLQYLGVSVLLSAVKQSTAVLALAAQAEICVVECVSEDELSLFSRLSGTTPVSDCCMIEAGHVATLTFCQPILLGAHRYGHILVICGPGEGQTDQYACAFRDGVRMLLTTLEPTGMTATAEMTSQLDKSISSNVPSSQQCVMDTGCVIAAGGTFEFLLHHALLKYGSNFSVSDNTNKGIPTLSHLFAKALLSVPRQIYSRRPQHFLHTETRILTSVHCSRKADILSKDFMLDSGLESVSCKYQLLLAVLQCVTSLLRVDTVLYTHTALHTQPDRLANIL
uniref:Bardet-Biedl syndrome 10 n=1 Tax=Anabas testudineus TaxID=64144 RepID=A0A3Q1HE94_ANATE